MLVKKENRPFYKEGRGGGVGRGRRQGVRGSSSDRAHLQLSQIISAREVRGGEMSKYLNKFRRSLLRAGRSGKRSIVGKKKNGVERGWESWGIRWEKKGGLWCWGCCSGGGGGGCMWYSLCEPEQEHELNENQRICHRGRAHFRQFPSLA